MSCSCYGRGFLADRKRQSKFLRYSSKRTSIRFPAEAFPTIISTNRLPAASAASGRFGKPRTRSGIMKRPKGILMLLRLSATIVVRRSKPGLNRRRQLSSTLQSARHYCDGYSAGTLKSGPALWRVWKRAAGFTTVGLILLAGYYVAPPGGARTQFRKGYTA